MISCMRIVEVFISFEIKCDYNHARIMEIIRITLAIIALTFTILEVNGVYADFIPHVLEKLSDFYRDHAVFTAPGFVYGTCDQSEPETTNERRCSLALQTSDSLKNDYEHLRLCNVTFQASAERGKIGRDFDFYALEGRKAIVRWSYENKNDRYGIVDFSNCSVVYAKIDDLDIHLSYVAAANNETIDIIVKNTNGKQCRNALCKLTLDFEGNVVEDLQEWLKSPYNLTALVKSPSRGHLAVDYTGSSTRTLRVYAVDDHGETDIIKEFPANDDRLEDVIETSTTYQMLTVCYALEMNVSCAQFDLNGTLKFEKRLSPSDRLHSLKVHNLPGGGFVLLTTDCLDSDTEKCIPFYRGSYIWYLDAIAHAVFGVIVD